MVFIVFLFLVFVLVLYAYQNHSREFEATASAIQQIWSGSCRMSCRSKYTSGPLETGQRTVAESDSCQTNQSAAGHSACVCETCPCALIENVLRTCRPATSVYNQSIEFISSGYYNIVKALCDAQKYVERLAECGVSCQRQVQLLSIQQVSSGDNINFINHTAVRAEGNIDDPELNQSKKVKGSRKVASLVQRKLHLGAEKEAEFSQRSKHDEGISNKPPTTAAAQKVDLNVKQFEPAASCSESESSVGTMSDRTSCSRCIEKGKTCIGSCPRSNESGCPVQCLIKAGVFVVLTVFVLYLPLGDPYKHCNGSKATHGKKMAMCCLCDIYLVSTKVAHKSMEISELIYEWISDLLYELKLKFYSLLGRIDRDDLCRTTCSNTDSAMVQDDLEKKTQRRACRGMRRCKLKNANV